jgi:hypothetical protein
VVLTDNGNPLDAGTYLLNSYGYTEDPTIQLSGGSHTLQANYAGDNSYNASTASVPITVIPASTTMGTIYIWNPVVGYQLSPSVYVNTTSSGLAPTGTVTFYANGTPMTGPVTYTPYNGGPNRGNASLNASLNTTTSPFPTPGTYAITASYSGDANYTSSTAAPQNISVKFPMPAVALQSSSYSVPGGTTLTFTATVYSSSSTIAPTGTLTFTSDTYGQLPGTPTYSTITDPSGNLDLQATLTYTINASDNFMVTYSGDANYPGNTTGSGLITVTGTDFNLTFPQSTMTVLPGQSNSLNLIVGLQSDSPPVTFGATACSGLPAESACSFSPSSAGRTSVVQVTVTSTAPHQVARLGRPSGLPFWASSGVTLAGVFLLGVSGKRRPWSKFLGLIFLAVLAFGIGCGGGGGGGGGHNDPGTPAGTYPITVTGTSGSGANAISHTTSFTLVVQ